jgi:hypothetical protein
MKAKENMRRIDGKRSMQNGNTPWKEDSVIEEIKTPAEEEIRKLANELYLSRIETGEEGSDVSDWLNAEAILATSFDDDTVDLDSLSPDQ